METNGTPQFEDWTAFYKSPTEPLQIVPANRDFIQILVNNKPNTKPINIVSVLCKYPASAFLFPVWDEDAEEIQLRFFHHFFRSSGKPSAPINGKT